jgi:hypothetical protein
MEQIELYVLFEMKHAIIQDYMQIDTGKNFIS